MILIAELLYVAHVFKNEPWHHMNNNTKIFLTDSNTVVQVINHDFKPILSLSLFLYMYKQY